MNPLFDESGKGHALYTNSDFWYWLYGYNLVVRQKHQRNIGGVRRATVIQITRASWAWTKLKQDHGHISAINKTTAVDVRKLAHGHKCMLLARHSAQVWRRAKFA